MAGLSRAIHALGVCATSKDVDAREASPMTTG